MPHENIAPGFQTPYEARDTPDRGRGLFAAAPVCSGAIIWRLVPGANALVFRGEKDIRAYLQAKLSTHEQRRDFIDHSFHYAGKVIYILDEGKLMNHDKSPNVVSDENGNVFAARDVAKGEEFLEDYGSFEHPKWYYDLHDEFGAPHEYFEKDMVNTATLSDSDRISA